MHIPDGQKILLKEDSLATIEEVSKYEVVVLRRYAEVHKMNDNDGKITEMVSWVRSVRFFKKIGAKRENQDVRNMMNARLN